MTFQWPFLPPEVGLESRQVPRNTELGSAAYCNFEMFWRFPVVNITGNYQLTPDDSHKIFLVTAAATLTLPQAADCRDDWQIFVKGQGAIATIARSGSDTIDGSTSSTSVPVSQWRGIFYRSSTQWITMGEIVGATVIDGDYGDVTVASGVWTVDADINKTWTGTHVFNAGSSHGGAVAGVNRQSVFDSSGRLTITYNDNSAQNLISLKNNAIASTINQGYNIVGYLGNATVGSDIMAFQMRLLTTEDWLSVANESAALAFSLIGDGTLEESIRFLRRLIIISGQLTINGFVAEPPIVLNANHQNQLVIGLYAAKADIWATGRTITLTGDVTGASSAFDGSGNLSFATTIVANAVGTAEIADDAVTFAKMQNITSDRLLGRDTASAGNVEEISLDATLEFSGSQIIRRAAITGDVSIPVGSNVATLTSVVLSEIAANADGVGLDALELPRNIELGGAAYMDPADFRRRPARTLAATYQLTPDDKGTLFIVTTSITITLPLGADCSDDWEVLLKARSGVTITLNRTSSDTIDGGTTISVASGTRSQIFRTGTTSFEAA